MGKPLSLIFDPDWLLLLRAGCLGELRLNASALPPPVLSGGFTRRTRQA
jgi:hypothetical protein